MDVWVVAALLGAGVGAGIVNAVVGGGSLITFPTLLALGLDPVAANVTNSVAVTPGYVASVWGSRAELREYVANGGPVRRLIPTTLAGTAVGCALLLGTPQRAFEMGVPYLVLGANAVLAFQQRRRGLG